jgi:hypothetical protein
MLSLQREFPDAIRCFNWPGLGSSSGYGAVSLKDVCLVKSLILASPPFVLSTTPVSCAQVWHYFTTRPKDSMIIKIMVRYL